eukprot:COSAG01_NODE_10667_length_2108_cov_4.084619_1_plen_85_part_00
MTRVSSSVHAPGCIPQRTTFSTREKAWSPAFESERLITTRQTGGLGGGCRRVRVPSAASDLKLCALLLGLPETPADSPVRSSAK